MARRRRHGRNINGILILNKPRGISSNGALQAAKRLFFAAKAGHTGSLDPLATGVLPICFGEATKFSQFLLDSDKRYISTIRLGIRTTTGDSQGDVVTTHSTRHISKEDILSTLAALEGDINQTPPMYSALKHQGRPLYKLAREGIEVERKIRQITIYQMNLLDFRQSEQTEIDIDVSCSKGTYIRALAEDIGIALGCGAHVTALHRSVSGPFRDEDAISLEALESMRGNGGAEVLDHLLHPMDRAVSHLVSVTLTQEAAHSIRRGQIVLVQPAPPQGMVKLVLETGEFIGLGMVSEDGRVAPRRLIVLS